jgi:hypothetical protein
MKNRELSTRYIYWGCDAKKLKDSKAEYYKRIISDSRMVAKLDDDDYISLMSKNKRASRGIERHGADRDAQWFLAYISHLKTLFKATPENPQTKEQALHNIKIACNESRRMSVREFVIKHNPTWHTSGKIDIGGANLHGIQAARTNIGVVDLDWAITLAGFNLGLRICIFNAFLYASAKPLWNLTRSESEFYNYFHEDERRAILMADQMTLCGKRFHQLFPYHYGQEQAR